MMCCDLPTIVMPVSVCACHWHCPVLNGKQEIKSHLLILSKISEDTATLFSMSSSIGFSIFCDGNQWRNKTDELKTPRTPVDANTGWIKCLGTSHFSYMSLSELITHTHRNRHTYNHIISIVSSIWSHILWYSLRYISCAHMVDVYMLVCMCVCVHWIFVVNISLIQLQMYA